MALLTLLALAASAAALHLETKDTVLEDFENSVHDLEDVFVEVEGAVGRGIWECPGPLLWPDPDNCQCFYDCANMIPFHICCGEGTLYSPELMVCVFPFQVDCGDRPMPGTTRPPTPTKPTTMPTTPPTTKPTTTPTTRPTTQPTTPTTTTTLATTPTTPTTTTTSGGCGEFEAAAADLGEGNIVGIEGSTDTPAVCQVLCREEPLCTWFTHFSSSCYLLAQRGDMSTCEGCVSGPQYPDFDSCPWPPAPTTPTTTTTTTTTPAPTTTTPAPTTTTPAPTTTTTTTPTPPTTPGSDCGGFHRGSSCELEEMNIVGRGHDIMVGQCQDTCAATENCHFFTWYPMSGLTGDCWLLSHCDTLETCSGCISGPGTGGDVDFC